MTNESPQEILRGVAELLDNNSSATFGGAVVIIPPSGDPATMVLLPHRADEVFFWTQANMVLKKALDDLEDARRGHNPHGFR